jgi:hypothetical protein
MTVSRDDWTRRLFRLAGAVRRDPAVEVWFHGQSDESGTIARRWFEAMRGCGDDVREVLHDGHPTACVADAAFGYVNAFSAHVNVGFFQGAGIAARPRTPTRRGAWRRSEMP